VPARWPDDGETALFVASQNGDVGAVRLLLSAGAHADDANTNNTTMLMVAAHSGKTEVVRLLLKSILLGRKSLNATHFSYVARIYISTMCYEHCPLQMLIL
jgi:ankyrin repeat protein